MGSCAAPSAPAHSVPFIHTFINSFIQLERLSSSALSAPATQSHSMLVRMPVDEDSNDETSRMQLPMVRPTMVNL